MEQFDFGENWKNYSKNAISNKRVEQAKVDFSNLLEGIDIYKKTFLDIGFGQGLSLQIATELGAKTIGCDINPKCKSILRQNQKFFKKNQNIDIPIILGSILDPKTINEIKSNERYFDIVHSWGVLHHTGKMWDALKIASELVASSGYLIIAIYNKNKVSNIWLIIKKIYNKVPIFLKKMMLYSYLPLLYIRSLFSKTKDKEKSRGMNIYYDAVDWLGGYPYEFASKQEIVGFFDKEFELIKLIPTWGFSGCNQYVFKRKSFD